MNLTDSQLEFAPGKSSETPVSLTFNTDCHSWSLVPIRAALGTGPVHFCVADGLFDLARMAETLADRLVRSTYSLREDAERGVGYWSNLTIRLDENTHVHCDEDTLRVYAASPEQARSTAEKLSKTFAREKAPKPATFQIVKKTSDGIDTESVALDKIVLLDSENLALHYGEAFPAWHTSFLERLQNRRTGLSILDGPPGTGKTSYLRQLILELKDSHRFYFIGSANLGLLRDAEFVDFWASERRLHENSAMVVILEDAESALMPRQADNRQEVSLLLNITDGILGEFLRLQVICTINCALKELDQALLRPGRLTAHHYFGPLPAERARVLADKLGKPLPETTAPEFTLAEIFSGRPDPTRREPGKIGFGG
jgi:hypothetical protein